MLKTLSKSIIEVCILCIWLVLLFIQHLVTVVVFGPNQWYMYVIVTVCFILEFLILSFYEKKSSSRVFLWICHYLSVSGLNWNVFLILFIYRSEDISLCLLSAVVDIVGIIFTVLFRKKQRRQGTVWKTGDGSLS